MLPSDFHETLKIVWRPNVRGLGREEHCGARVGSGVDSARVLHAQSICSMARCCQSAHSSKHVCDAHVGTLSNINSCEHYLLTSNFFPQDFPYDLAKGIEHHNLWSSQLLSPEDTEKVLGVVEAHCVTARVSPPVHIVGFWRCPAMYTLHSSNQS